MQNNNQYLIELPPQLMMALPGYITDDQKELLRGVREDSMALAVVIGRLLRSGDSFPVFQPWIEERLRRWSQRDLQFVVECTRVLLLANLELISERAAAEPWVRRQIAEAFDQPVSDVEASADSWKNNEASWVTALISQADDAASALVVITAVTTAQQLDAVLPGESELRRLLVDVRRSAEPIAALIADHVQSAGLAGDLWLDRIAGLSVDEWWLLPLRAKSVLSKIQFPGGSTQDRVVSLRDYLIGVAQESLAAADSLPSLIARTDRYVLRLSDDALYVILEEPVADAISTPVTLVATDFPSVIGEDTGRYTYRFRLSHPVFDCADAALHLPLAGGDVIVPLRTR